MLSSPRRRFLLCWWLRGRTSWHKTMAKSHRVPSVLHGLQPCRSQEPTSLLLQSPALPGHSPPAGTGQPARRGHGSGRASPNVRGCNTSLPHQSPWEQGNELSVLQAATPPPPCSVPEPLYAEALPVLGLGQLLFTLVLSPSLPKLPCCQLPVMRILFFLVAVLFFLFQAAPGKAGKR